MHQHQGKLAYKEVAHSMLTTNICFTLIKCEKNMNTRRIEMHQMEMPKYRLGAVTSIDLADDTDAYHKDIWYPLPYTLIEEDFGEKKM